MSEALGVLYEWYAGDIAKFRRGFAASGCMISKVFPACPVRICSRTAGSI